MTTFCRQCRTFSLIELNFTLLLQLKLHRIVHDVVRKIDALGVARQQFEESIDVVAERSNLARQKQPLIFLLKYFVLIYADIA